MSGEDRPIVGISGADSMFVPDALYSRSEVWVAGIPRDLTGADDDVEAMERKLAELMSEHRDLDDIIAQVMESGPFDQLQIQRLKKRKLLLKDEIARLESQLLPDIIA